MSLLTVCIWKLCVIQIIAHFLEAKQTWHSWVLSVLSCHLTLLLSGCLGGNMSASSGGTGNVVAAKFPGPGKRENFAQVSCLENW